MTPILLIKVTCSFDMRHGDADTPHGHILQKTIPSASIVVKAFLGGRNRVFISTHVQERYEEGVKYTF